jgi:hypothetical protein
VDWFRNILTQSKHLLDGAVQAFTFHSHAANQFSNVLHSTCVIFGDFVPVELVVELHYTN